MCNMSFTIYDKSNNGFEFSSLADALNVMKYDITFCKLFICGVGLESSPTQPIEFYRKVPADKLTPGIDAFLGNISDDYASYKNTEIFWIAKNRNNSKYNEVVVNMHTRADMTPSEFKDELFKAAFVEIMDDVTFYNKIMLEVETEAS